jgi:SAM-dependent MidA family methyltransferase
MGSAAPGEAPPAPVSPAFLAAFRAQAGAGGAMTFARFMELALYDPAVGYYRRAQPRVGTGAGTDFVTATTTGPVFGELVAAAAVTLLGGRDPRGFTFVEIGAEPGADGWAAGVLAGLAHPFGAARTVAVGEAALLAGPCVVFANELLDAQPFHRYVFRAGAWRELGVALRGDRLAETELPIAASADGRFADLAAPWGPAPEGYVIDAPVGALLLLETLAAQPWRGVFLTCDYGKTWRELAEATPQGTGRAYYRHRQEKDLLARPGEQDLTCHVCWDWLEAALARHRFERVAVAGQEAFFMQQAGDAIAAAILAEAEHFSPRKAALMQLLHPALYGQKFQVLSGFRGE